MTSPPPYSRIRAVRNAVVVALVVVSGLILWDGSQRRRGEPRSGDGLPGVVPEALARLPGDTRFRVAAFNIQSGRGMDGKTDLSRTAGLLRSFDLIGLNEAQGHVHSSVDQARALGGMLKLAYLFAPTERRWWHDDFGNGLLSRLPVRHWTIIPMPGAKASGYRNVIHARIDLDTGTTINVLVTHLDRTTDRRQQLRYVGELFQAMDAPAILMGDLNTRGDDPDLRAILSSAGVQDPIGDTPDLPVTERIDWILTRGLRTIEAGVVITDVSDHPMVWAELELPKSDGVELPATRPGD